MSATLDIQGNASGAEKALDKVEAGIKDVKAATDQAADASEAWLKDVIEDVEEATKKLDEAGDAAKKMGGSDVTGKLTTLFTGLTAGIEVVKGLAQGAKEFRQYVKEAAESGNVAFQDFNQTLEGVESKFDRVVTRFASSNFGQGVFREITEWADGAVEGLDAVGDTSDTVMTQLNALGSSLANALGAEDAEAMFDKRISQITAASAAARQAVEHEMERARIAKQTADADKIAGDLEKSRANERMQNAISHINDQSQINMLVQRELQLLKDLASQDKLTTEQQEKSRAKIGSLEARRRQLQSEAKAEQERQLEERIREEERAAKEIFDAQMKEQEEYEREQKRLEQEEEKRLEKEKETAERAERDKQEAITKAQEEAARERKSRVDAIANQDDVKGLSSQIQKMAGSQDALIKRLASNAGAEGSDEYRAAHRAAVNQARGGAQTFSPEQIAQATQQNAQAQVQSLQASGQLSKEVIDALMQNVQATAQFNQEQGQLSQQVAAITQVLGDTIKNARTRAQSQGRKQI